MSWKSIWQDLVKSRLLGASRSLATWFLKKSSFWALVQSLCWALSSSRAIQSCRAFRFLCYLKVAFLPLTSRTTIPIWLSLAVVVDLLVFFVFFFFRHNLLFLLLFVGPLSSRRTNNHLSNWGSAALFSFSLQITKTSMYSHDDPKGSSRSVVRQRKTDGRTEGRGGPPDNTN